MEMYQDEKSVPVTLPEEVRYALAYGGALMGKQEIQALIDADMPWKCAYLLAKSFTGVFEQQRDFFEGLSDAWLQEMNGETRRMRSFLGMVTGTLDDSCAVFGSRLAQVCRQGFEQWDRLYADALLRCARGTVTPVFVLCGTVIGLPWAFNAVARGVKSFFALNPAWILDQSQDYCGYEFNLLGARGERVRLLGKDFSRPTGIRIIDDVRKTGKTERIIRAFWGNSVDFEPLCVAGEAF